ncbi:uncharacterized protein C8orf34 homolog isoform X1 [Chiloscyllium plagiosum]|uniref:uncharacterized protein C8orf34 homolog isoform X1 n=2 Tax=Chiloscyllium plagiosum TaxID=36176 RepID=UPI001CB7C6ED|nr:uncharacterized protein C8orf34 homolog isoform X1 [Chiloscyllium plagiosum]
MASQQSRIQTYLEKNKIGSLFEEMMTKLITETPDQPIPFLISHLQNKQGSCSQLSRTLSGSAALWAETENKGSRRDCRSYDKPWLINAKKPKKSKSDLAVSNISPPTPESKSLPRSIEQATWEWRTKPESQTFDELNHILQESKKLGKALESLSQSIATDEFDQDLRAYGSSLVRPRVVGEWVGREETDADPLAAEMLQPPVPRVHDAHEDSQSLSSPRLEQKSKGLRQQQQQHKKLLAAMLSQESFDSVPSTAPSVADEDIEDEDDAMELLEDLDDLRMEGITDHVPSGSRFSQGRSLYFAEPQAKVILNICSRCARFQGNSLNEESDNGSQVSHSPEQAVPESQAVSPLLGVERVMQDEDEFESASQVSGPRQPFWESCLPPGQSGGSLSQKQPKDLMASKEMLSVEKHLTEPDKDCAAKTLTVESEMGSSLDMQSKSPMSNYHGDLSQTVLGQTLRPQTPTSLFGKEIPPWSQRGKLPQSSSPQNSRDGIPNNQYNRPQTSLTQGSRPATSNSQLYQTTRSSNPGNKEVFNNPNRMALPISHTGRRLSSPVNQAGKTAESPLQRSHLSELLVTHQPWTLPSDTESEGVDQEQDEGL